MFKLVKSVNVLKTTFMHDYKVFTNLFFKIVAEPKNINLSGNKYLL